MNKQEQWRLAAIILAHCDNLNGSESPLNRAQRAVAALSYIYNPLPWEYPWHEVIRSHRDRSAKRLAKSRPSA